MEKSSSNRIPLLAQVRQRSQNLPDIDSQAPEHAKVPAVVFCPLVLPHWEAPLEESHLLYITRSSQLRKHAGQVGFPGGVVEPQDKSLLEAGMREANEEVALRSEQVEMLCELPRAWTPSGYRLHPFLVATDQQSFVRQESEVASLHLVKISDLLTCPVRLETREWNARRYRVIYFDLEELCVWGVTGRITEFILTHFFDWESPP